MIVLLAVFFRLFLRSSMVEGARAQAEKGLQGKMQGHANMAQMAKQGTSSPAW